jgi:hypothetical protein
MSFSVEEDFFCNVYCEMVNWEWERSMQKALSESRAELQESRDRLNAVHHKGSLIMKKMQDTAIGTDKYLLLQNALKKVKAAQVKCTADFYERKHRHTVFTKQYRTESRKRKGQAKAVFNGMTLNQKVLLARSLMDRGIAVTACRKYLVAAEEHAASYGMAMDQVQESADLALHRETEKDIAVKEWRQKRVSPHPRRKEAKKNTYQRSGYAEGRKIEIC